MTVPSSERSSKYRVIATIGRGGMGSVYLAVTQESAGFTKLVVLKQARPDLVREPQVLTMFLDEARLAARLNHPNVVQTYESGELSGSYYIAMEYLDGQSLAQIRRQVKPEHFPLSMQVRILIEALAGLHYAHELADFDGTPLRIVHRDANPQNIFVTYDGQIKVVDFGIAKAAVSRTRTVAGMLKGKVTYMAPEQARQQPLDRRADIFAVGVMLWEAMSGTRMWKGFDEVQILTRLLEGRIPPPPADSPELGRICRRALASAPADRYATAAELQYELERWLEQDGDEVPARAVGRFVAMHFDDERTAMKARIERKLGDSSRSKPADPDVTVTEGPASSAPASSDMPPSAPESSGRPASAPAAPEGPGVSPASPGRARMPAENTDTLRSSHEPSLSEREDYDTIRRSSVSFDSAKSRPAPQRSRRTIALSAVAMIAVGATAAVLTMKAPARTPSTAAAAAPGSSASESASTPPLPTAVNDAPAPASTASASAARPVGSINLTIFVRPATARITIDDAAVGAAFYKGKLPKDGQIHRLHVEAPGFVPMDQVIGASGDISLTLALDKKSPPAP